MFGWRNRLIKSEIQPILSQLEELQLVPEIWIKSTAISAGLCQLTSVGLVGVDMVLSNSRDWAIDLKFQRRTDDGPLQTSVYSADDRCVIRVELNMAGKVVPLKSLDVTTYGSNKRPGARDAINFVRDWVRRKSLPDITSQKALLCTTQERRQAELEALRRKHLP